MRNLWLRIGLGAAFVFGAGMFVVTLGRQVKNSVVSHVDNGSRVRVPLSLLPFRIDHSRVGSIQSVDVRHAAEVADRVRLTVKLRNSVDADQYADCVFVVDGPRQQGLFSCMPLAEAEAEGFVKIGEVRLTPGEMVRPLMVDGAEAGEWFDRSDAERVNITAGEGGASIQVTDAQGTKIVDISAGADGALLKVKAQDGKEVVNLNAGANGVKVDVKKQQ